MQLTQGVALFWFAALCKEGCKREQSKDEKDTMCHRAYQGYRFTLGVNMIACGTGDFNGWEMDGGRKRKSLQRLIVRSDKADAARRPVSSGIPRSGEHSYTRSCV